MITSTREYTGSQAPAFGSAGNAGRTTPETVAIGPGRLQGHLLLGLCPTGLVLLVRSTGRGNGHENANRFVAETLRRHRFGTLSLNLLTDDEAADERRRSDIALLTRRVGEVLQWIDGRPQLTRYRCGLFGAGTGGAALLQAAAAVPGRVGAVVARGARLDLAWPSLPAVRAPTLLITGTDVAQELELHSAALRELQCSKRLEVIPGATLEFQDASVLGTVAELSAWWLMAHLGDGAMF